MYEKLANKSKKFWSQVCTLSEDECWLWRPGSADRDGYGRFSFTADGRRTHCRAHRAAYMLHHGRDVPSEVILRHACDQRLCCNPLHLAEGGHADNVRDRVERERSAAGGENGRAKLTAEDIPDIRRRLANGEGAVSISKSYGVDRACIRAIRVGRTWKLVK